MELTVGIKNTEKEVVTADKTAKHVGSGTAGVYSTPSMIAFMEGVSLHAVAPYLAENQTTVGTAVNIQHRAATPEGDTVWCDAEVIEIDRRRITFAVRVYSAEGKTIGEGTHDRFVVNTDKFK